MEELKNNITRRGLSLLCLLTLFAAGARAQDSAVYNLKQCIDIAIKNNLQVMQSDFQMQYSAARLQQSRAASLPYASAYANQGISMGKSINPFTNTFINKEILTGQYGLSGGMILWNGFSTFNNMRQSVFAYQAGKSDYDQAKIDVTINVMLAYLQILSNEEQLNQAKSQVEVSKVQTERLSVLDQSKAISPSVLHDTRGQLANDQLLLINTRAALAASKISLAQLMNVNFPEKTRFEKIDVSEEAKTYDTNPDNLYSEALKNFPMIKEAEYRKMSALKGLHAARGNMSPVLRLNGNIGTNYSDAALVQRYVNLGDGATDQYVLVNNTPTPVFAPQYGITSEKISFANQFKNNLSSYVGLSLQFTLFNSLNTKTQMSLAKITKEQAEFQQQNTGNNLKSAIQLAYSDMNASYERLTVLNQQVKDYEASFRIATGKFEKGAMSTVDYVIAKSNYDKASMNLIAARFDYILKVKVLDYYRGKY